MSADTESEMLVGWAMSIICNVDGGDWKQSHEWINAARQWLDDVATQGRPQPEGPSEE